MVLSNITIQRLTFPPVLFLTRIRGPATSLANYTCGQNATILFALTSRQQSSYQVHITSYV
uniref:MSP domain-containing protein n=1 Tax=Ascaris lumbricoides TaxID=6252 RepID=A0A0M3IXK0_ASCLU